MSISLWHLISVMQNLKRQSTVTEPGDSKTLEQE